MHDARLGAGVLSASLVYAVVRYHVFGGVSYEQLPMFIGNKAIAVASLVLIGASRIVSDKTRRKRLGLGALGLALLHVLLSFVILDPSYLPAHYRPDARLQWYGETSVLTGAIATTLLLWLAYATMSRPIDRQPVGTSLLPMIGRLVLVLVGLHTVLLGFRSWLAPEAWPGALPPLTLISSAIAAAFLALRRRAT